MKEGNDKEIQSLCLKYIWHCDDTILISEWIRHNWVALNSHFARVISGNSSSFLCAHKSNWSKTKQQQQKTINSLNLLQRFELRIAGNRASQSQRILRLVGGSTKSTDLIHIPHSIWLYICSAIIFVIWNVMPEPNFLLDLRNEKKPRSKRRRLHCFNYIDRTLYMGKSSILRCTCVKIREIIRFNYGIIR